MRGSNKSQQASWAVLIVSIGTLWTIVTAWQIDAANRRVEAAEDKLADVRALGHQCVAALEECCR